MEGRRGSGERFHPWGTDVRGRLIYDTAGRVALQIAKGGRAPFASEDLEAGTADEMRRAFDDYHAWFGAFTVEPGTNVVVHRIEGSLFPNWEGGEQRRTVRFEGDELALVSPPLPYGGDTVEFVTRWVRR
jgi:lipocalin-like protein